MTPRPRPCPGPAAARRTGSWVRPVWAGIALLLAGSPVAAVVQGTSWWGYAAGAVALVVAVGLLGAAACRTAPAADRRARSSRPCRCWSRRCSPDSGVLGVLPGPAAAGELAALVADAATQIRTEVAPVPATPAMLLLVTLAFGVTAVAVHAVAVGAAAPAAAGVLLLAVFAVPAALADDLLPTWMLVAAAAGFGLLLFARPGPPRRTPPVASGRRWCGDRGGGDRPGPGGGGRGRRASARRAGSRAPAARAPAGAPRSGSARSPPCAGSCRRPPRPSCSASPACPGPPTCAH